MSRVKKHLRPPDRDQAAKQSKWTVFEATVVASCPAFVVSGMLGMGFIDNALAAWVICVCTMLLILIVLVVKSINEIQAAMAAPPEEPEEPEDGRRLIGPHGGTVVVPAEHYGHETVPWRDMGAVRCAECSRRLDYKATADGR